MEAGILVLAGLVLAVAMYAGVAWAVMALWNVIAIHFGLPEVTFWVAGAAVLLLGLLRPSVTVKGGDK